MNISKVRDGIAGAVSVGVALALFEIVLVGKVDAQETPVGIGVAVLAAVVVVSALAAGNVRYALRFSWLWPALLVARNIVRDTFVVYGVLLRHLAGAPVRDAYENVPFDQGGEDPVSAARRALVVAGVSTSPNEIVLAVDEERKTLRVHALAISKSPRHSLQWPL